MKLAILFLAGAALAHAGWPKPKIAIRHLDRPPASTNIADTRSMEPLIAHGDYVSLRPVKGDEPLERGMIVVFDRGDSPRVIHMIADTCGDWIYMSGLNNRRSDGWFHRSKVKDVATVIWTARKNNTSP